MGEHNIEKKKEKIDAKMPQYPSLIDEAKGNMVFLFGKTLSLLPEMIKHDNRKKQDFKKEKVCY